LFFSGKRSLPKRCKKPKPQYGVFSRPSSHNIWQENDLLQSERCGFSSACSPSTLLKDPQRSVSRETAAKPRPMIASELMSEPRLSLRGLGTGSPRRRALKARKIGPAAAPCEAVWVWHAIRQSPAESQSVAPSALASFQLTSPRPRKLSLGSPLSRLRRLISKFRIWNGNSGDGSNSQIQNSGPARDAVRRAAGSDGASPCPVKGRRFITFKVWPASSPTGKATKGWSGLLPREDSSRQKIHAV
jgi:hypothetical protein